MAEAHPTRADVSFEWRDGELVAAAARVQPAHTPLVHESHKVPNMGDSITEGTIIEWEETRLAGDRERFAQQCQSQLEDGDPGAGSPDMSASS